MSDDERPKWAFDMPFETFKKVDYGHITKVTHHWEYTSEDSAIYWVNLHFATGGKDRVMKAPLNFDKYFEFSPSQAGLFRLTYQGARARDQAKLIDAWEDKHKREIAQYNLLKKKYGDVTTQEPEK